MTTNKADAARGPVKGQACKAVRAEKEINDAAKHDSALDALQAKLASARARGAAISNAAARAEAHMARAAELQLEVNELRALAQEEYATICAVEQVQTNDRVVIPCGSGLDSPKNSGTPLPPANASWGQPDADSTSSAGNAADDALNLPHADDGPSSTEQATLAPAHACAEPKLSTSKAEVHAYNAEHYSKMAGQCKFCNRSAKRYRAMLKGVMCEDPTCAANGNYRKRHHSVFTDSFAAQRAQLQEYVHSSGKRCRKYVTAVHSCEEGDKEPLQSFLREAMDQGRTKLAHVKDQEAEAA